MFEDSEDSEDEPQPVPPRNSSSETSYDEDEEEIKKVPIKEEPKKVLTDGAKHEETLVQGVQIEEPKMSSYQTQPQPRRKRFIPKYEVEGVYKVILGEETQIFIEMVVGNHINVQYPWKFISKAKLIECINEGGELSEFFPIRQEIEDYPDEDMLMGYIVDESSNDDEFYICCTIEARDHCKQQSDKFIRRQEKKLEKAVQKKPRPWVNLGSDAEIMQQDPINSRTLMELEIKAKFPTDYDPTSYDIRDTNSVRDGFIELKPYRQKFNNVFRRRIDCASQITPALVHNYAQTQLRYPTNMWTQSIADALGQIGDFEGGGDAALDYDSDLSSDDEGIVKKQPVDEVGLATYRAAQKRMRRPSYIKLINRFVSSRQSELESMIELNTVMDMYHNDYPNLATTQHIETLGTMTFEDYVCFTDVRAKDKYVSCAVFHPMWSGIVAIAYSDCSPTVMKAQTTTCQDPIQRAVYGLNPVLIWSHIDSLIPKLYLEAPREVKALSFCPFNENILIGGLINGQVVIWDLTNKLENVEKIEILSEKREKYRIAMNSHMEWMKSISDRAVVNYTACSSLLNCHNGTVSAIKWLPPNFSVTTQGKIKPMPHDKSSLQFLTVSVDGTILVWNMSVENLTFVEGKKVKKSKRVPIRPSGLLVDISPFQILDRILQPCYKIILGKAGLPWRYPLQSFAISPPNIKYIYTPRNTGTGRKYFICEIIKPKEGEKEEEEKEEEEKEQQEQEDEEMNSIFYFGSQQGTLIRANWEGHEFNTGEAVNSEYGNIKYFCNIHDGNIVATHKNPFIDSITVTVGGKIFAIWSDKLSGRPLLWKKRPNRLTDGAWSQYKPSILFVVNSEGDIETWDLLLKSDKPISVQTLSGTMLTGVSLHTLPLIKNIIGVSDVNGSFRLFINPPVFMLGRPSYIDRMQAMINRELKVMESFITWQANFIKKNPHVLLEIKKKEGIVLAEKEEERRRLLEEQEKREEEEAEARRLERMKIVGPEERWQKIVQKLIERTIAVKKRINRALLIEQEKPLRELEIQRLEKERRMLEIMKNQKTIFNDTVAILFPEAIKKPEKPKETLLADNKDVLKKEYIEEYYYLKKTASKMVKKNPYSAEFRWEATLAEGKERRAALNAHENFIKIHYSRIHEDGRESLRKGRVVKDVVSQKEIEDEEVDDESSGA